MTQQQHSHTAAYAALAALGALLASYWVWRRCASHWFHSERLFQGYVEALTLSAGRLRALRDDFVREAKLGLQGKKSSMLMMPSMVDVLPTGEETGEYLAIDIGGTNFRTIFAELGQERGKVVRLEMDDAAIPTECFTSHVDQMFDVLAAHAIAFLQKLGRDPAAGIPPCGFCFSFPVQQTALDRGRVLRKTKSFDNEGFVGADPAQGLRAAFARLGHKVGVPVLLNDAVGTLAGGHYTDPAVLVGLILGTGTNASYVEQTRNVATIPPGAHMNSEEVVVNTEWGDFQSPLLPRTQVDLELDAATPNAGRQQLEKLLSGLYMGEVARRILLHLAEETDLFRGAVPAALRTPFALGTPALSQVDADTAPSLPVTAQIMEEKLGLSAEDCDLYARQRVQRICHLVAKRSAALAACCLAGLLSLVDRDGRGAPMRPVTVAVDGGVFEHFMAYRGYLAAALADVLGEAAASQVTLRQVRDASSLGTAFLAAAASALPKKA